MDRERQQTAETDYTDLELLYNAYMEPALRLAIGDFFRGWSQRETMGVDVGCGPGGVTRLLAEASGARLISGIDLSAAHLSAAQDRLAHGSAGACSHLVAADLRGRLPFADDSIDWAWASDVLWPDILPEPSRAVAELRRIVRPGGHVAAFFGNWLRAIFLPGYSQIEHQLSAATEIACFNRTIAPAAHHENALGWLRSAGFQDLRLSSYLIQYQQPLPPIVRRYLQEVIFAEYRRPEVGERARALGLSDADWATWLSISAPDAPENILNSPDYYCLQVGKMMIGVVPEAAAPGDQPSADAPERTHGLVEAGMVAA
jgi:SAM-dependent methyltransferase